MNGRGLHPDGARESPNARGGVGRGGPRRRRFTDEGPAPSVPILARVSEVMADVPAIVDRLPALDGVLPAHFAGAVADLPGRVLLDSARRGRAGRWSFLAADPIAIVEGTTAGADPFVRARHALGRLGRGLAGPAVVGDDPPFRGGLVGYLGYDLARRLERLPALALDDHGLPDLRLALHDWVIAWDNRTGRCWLAGRAVDGDRTGLARRLADVRARAVAWAIARAARSTAKRPPVLTPGEVPGPASAAARPLFTSALDRAGWAERVELIREAIAAGELYQVNLARRLQAPFAGDPWPLFDRLRTGEPAAFAAYLDLGAAPGLAAPGGLPSSREGRRAIISASPEPFLALDATGLVRADPIKGTRPRGRSAAEDRAFAAELLESAKDRAENLMIVDVLRNDLGRVCRPGTVRVPRLARLERTPSVQHLVSTVTGRLASGRDAFDLLAAAFPGGSITGAPKVRAMELIERLEPVRRGPYCGAALWIDADGAMGSSILIRTFVADGHRLTFHVGGGITWRSDAGQEWDETVAKARGPLRAIGAMIAGAGAGGPDEPARRDAGP